MSNIETKFTESTIVYSKEYNEFYCFVCAGDSIVVNYDEHNKNPKHLEALKQFKLIFSEDNGKIHCKLCNADLHWDNVKTHGKSHLIVPWYKPEEKFKAFVKNRIIACKKQYYCCSCGTIFLEWSAALSHTTDPRHCILNRKFPSIDKISPRLIDGGNHELLVREGLALIDSNYSTCKICRDEIVEIAEVLRHIETPRHRYNSHKFDEMFLKKEYIVPIIKDKKELFLTDVRISKISNLSESCCDYIKEENAIYSRCIVCEKTLLTAETKNHLDENDHAQAEERCGCEGITSHGKHEYKCEYCVTTIFGISSLHSHVKGRRHRAAVSRTRTVATNSKDEPERIAQCKKSKKKIKARCNRKKQEIIENPKELPKIDAKEPEKNSVQIESEKITDDYCIEKQNSANWLCKICHADFSCSREIEDHTMEKTHEESMKKFGCENIALIEPNLYRCGCCDCKIPGKQNVCDHLMGKRHSARLSATENAANSEGSVMTNTVEFPAITTEISKYNEYLRMMNLKKLKKRENSRDAWLQDISKTINMRCNVCHVEVADSADLHSHLASHLSLEFVNQKIDKNANIQCPSLMPDANKSANGDCAPETNSASVNDEISRVFANDDNENPAKIEYASSIDFGQVTSDLENDTEAIISGKKSTGRAADYLYFGKDHIYDIRERCRAIELGTKLCFISNEGAIYCLVCHKMVPKKLQSFFDHLSSLDHTTNLEVMEQDNTLFDRFVGQFSELKLANEYMEEKSDQLVKCLICNVEILNNDNFLQQHVDNENHKILRETMVRCAGKNFECIKARMQCDWYNVQKYWCVPCSKHFRSEAEFAKHLDSRRHVFSTTKTADIDKKLIYDFCSTCGLLWYGYRTTYAYHCLLSSHKWLLRDGHYALFDLPQLAKILLASTEKYVHNTLSTVREETTKERAKEKILLKQLVDTVKTKYERAAAHEFGSRVCGLATHESNINVFLDCGDMYDGPSKSTNRITELKRNVLECLSRDRFSWDTVELVAKNRRDSAIHALHRETNRSCHIFVENGLPVETTYLLKSFIDKFPLCQRMIIFLRQWLAVCDLSGHDGISNYAMYWHVVFYLQMESILPSIDALQAAKKQSRVIAGWQVGVSDNFTCKAERSYSLKELLIRFFTYYANFNFRYDVACPLVGKVTKKRFFVNLKDLPREMADYVNYMNYSAHGEAFDVNCPMCIQDPFDLRQNLTQSVTKLYLSRFRSCCSKSAGMLCSLQK